MKISAQPALLHKEVTTALNKRLNFADQFNSFIVTFSVDGGEDITVSNQLFNKNGSRLIPTSWITLDARGASTGSLGRSTTDEWTKTHLFLKNFSANNGTFTVRFFE